jgi:biotin transport system substrate-specific component
MKLYCKGLLQMSDKRTPSYGIVLGGMFIALFFLASNIFPPFYIVPSVPVTLQIFVVALMGGTLGVRGGLLSLAGLFTATIAGLPMMSGFGGGPAVFARPTAGFIVGWVFLVAVSGAASDILRRRRAAGADHHHTVCAALLAAAMIIGVLLDYLCGAVWLAVYNGTGLSAVPSFFAANLFFLPFDAIKSVMASLLCVFFAATPGLAKFAGVRMR